MPDTICLIDGHPHADRGHFCHALADAYAEGAAGAGHTIHRVEVAALSPPCLADPADFERAPSDSGMIAAREAISAASHVVVVFPLWLGTMPAMLKAFFEQMTRAGFAISDRESGGWPVQNLRGRSARIVVTMGMPALAYRLWFLNAGVSNLRRMILGMSGMGPVRQTTIGGIGALDADARTRWLGRVRDLGQAGR